MLLLLLLQLRTQLLLALLFGALLAQLLGPQILLLTSTTRFELLLFGTGARLILPGLLGCCLALRLGLQTGLLVIFRLLQASQASLSLLLETQRPWLGANLLQGKVSIVDSTAIVLFPQAGLTGCKGLLDLLLIMLAAQLLQAVGAQCQ